MTTIKEVSELANVSTATVSRVLNGHESVKAANRDKVMAAVEALGFLPNASAKALASNRTHSIGMLVGSFDGPFYGPLMHHAEETFRKHNLHLIVTSGQESRSNELNAIHFLRSKQVDGLIIHSDKLSDAELIGVVEQNPKTIIVNRLVPEIAGNCVYLNNELGGYVATKHLLENGHTKIACITGQLSKVDSRERLQGYRNALSEYGIEYDPLLTIEGRFDHEGNHDAAMRLLKRVDDLTAIFCQNDNIAIAAYDVCAELGLKIGQDLSIIGFDNDTHSQHIRPRLTTVDYPIRDIGVQAAKALLKLIEGKPQLDIENPLPKLIIRDSVSLRS